MRLSFYAREGALAYIPGAPKFQGQAPPYVGRCLVRGTEENTAAFPATSEPHVVDISGSTVDQQALNRWQRLANAGAVWCADEATAAACGVEFVPVTFSDGVWQRAVVNPKKGK
jgi:hypothetical protein